MKTWHKILLASLTVLIPGVGPFVFGILICLILSHDSKNKNDNLERATLLRPNPELDKKVIKIVISGSPGYRAGASCIVSRFVSDYYTDIWDPTLVEVNINDSLAWFKVQIWDVSSNPRLYPITDNFITGTQIVMFCYDLTNLESFNAIDQVLTARKRLLDDKFLVLVGNKVDLADEHRQVSYQLGEEYARKHGMLFFECSAKENTNVERMFSEATRLVLK